MIQRKLEVTYLHFERSTRVPPGTTVFSAAHWIELPTLIDQRSDVVRLSEALTAEGHDMQAPVTVLRTLPAALRAADFKVTAVLAGEHLVAVEPGDTSAECFGVAFDVGTTTLVGTLMNLPTGMAAGVASAANGQG